MLGTGSLRMDQKSVDKADIWVLTISGDCYSLASCQCAVSKLQDFSHQRSSINSTAALAILRIAPRPTDPDLANIAISYWGDCDISQRK